MAGSDGGAASRTGRIVILEQLRADGVSHVFGNPGTVEQGFLDALSDVPGLRYVLTLQESVAVLADDGYARAARRPAVVQLHSSPGIGNAVGALYQAKRGHAPLVVIAGDAGVRYLNMDAQMAADLVGMMEPVTKYATMVTDSRSVLRVLRRAFRIAATPPMGPVYVCLPMDVLDAPNDEAILPTAIPSTRTVPEPALIEQAAGMLLAAERPMIYVGDGIAHSGAEAELARVAETLGAEVWGADTGDLNMDAAHPLWQGTTGHMFGSSSLPITRKGDANLVVGTYMLPEVFPELGPIFAPGSKTIHFDLNAYEIAKNHPVDLAAVCDPKRTLDMLAGVLERRATQAFRARALMRRETLGAAKAGALEGARAADRAKFGGAVPTMAEFASILAARLPADAIVFDEALTGSPDLARHLPPRVPGQYFCTRGGSLGVGIPGAIGASIACPGRSVWGFTGDGGSLYTIQALWTAAKVRANAKFVVCDNGGYKLLKLNILQYWKERGIAERDFPESFDFGEPRVDFAKIAEGFGVPAERVARPADIAPAIDRALGTDGPFLIHLALPTEAAAHPAGCRCGQ